MLERASVDLLADATGTSSKIARNVLTVSTPIEGEHLLRGVRPAVYRGCRRRQIKRPRLCRNETRIADYRIETNFLLVERLLPASGAQPIDGPEEVAGAMRCTGDVGVFD